MDRDFWQEGYDAYGNFIDFPERGLTHKAKGLWHDGWNTAQADDDEGLIRPFDKEDEQDA